MSRSARTRRSRRLDEFTSEVFVSLRRRDRIATAGEYLRGLTHPGSGRSMTAMAEVLGVDSQRLQQFVTSSPWEVGPVRGVLAHRVVERLRPAAWVIGETGFPKDGDRSACVARQRVGSSDRIVNAQVSLALHAVSYVGSHALTWRLVVPHEWDDTTDATILGRRRAVGVPATERDRPRWQIALDLVDEAMGWGLEPPVIVVGADLGHVASFRRGLIARGLAYVVKVESFTDVPTDTTPPVRVMAKTLAATGESSYPLQWGRLLVRPGDGYVVAAVAGATADDVFDLAATTDRPEKDYDRLAGLGLRNFEGRSWLGWHHHVTLVSAADVFLAENP